jgi:hypothetical protein
MMLSDEQHWLKAGIEFNDGAPAIGSALTPGNSNCATGLFPGDPKEIWLRLTRKMLYDWSTPQMDRTGHNFAYVIFPRVQCTIVPLTTAIGPVTGAALTGC